MKQIVTRLLANLGFSEICGLIGLVSLCVGASMIYTPLPYFIVGVTLLLLSFLAARKGS